MQSLTCFGLILMSALSKLFNVAVVAVTVAVANKPSSDISFTIKRWVTCASWSVVLNDVCYIIV